MITAHPHFYLPNLSTFQNKNTFYGSFRRAALSGGLSGSRGGWGSSSTSAPGQGLTVWQTVK